MLFERLAQYFRGQPAVRFNLEALAKRVGPVRVPPQVLPDIALPNQIGYTPDKQPDLLREVNAADPGFYVLAGSQGPDFNQIPPTESL